MNTLLKICLPLLLCMFITSTGSCQPAKKVNIAVIQATGLPRQDPFMGDYDPDMVRPQMMAHFNKLLGLFEEAGEMNADLVCGPEDMQHIGAYGLHIDVLDPETGKIFDSSLSGPVPCPLTDLPACPLVDQVGQAIHSRDRPRGIGPSFETVGGFGSKPKTPRAPADHGRIETGAFK